MKIDVVLKNNVVLSGEFLYKYSSSIDMNVDKETAERILTSENCITLQVTEDGKFRAGVYTSEIERVEIVD